MGRPRRSPRRVRQRGGFGRFAPERLYIGFRGGGGVHWKCRQAVGVSHRPSGFRERPSSFRKLASGPHGPVLRNFHHDGAGAIDELRKRQEGDAIAALHHPDPRVGDVALVWGEPGTESRALESMEYLSMQPHRCSWTRWPGRSRTQTITKERWITMGITGGGIVLVVVHTWQDLTANSARLRIISARRPTGLELRLYEDNL